MKRTNRAELVGDQLTALEAFSTQADGIIDDDLVVQGQALYERASTRLRHGTGHVVVALAGPTGAGKSSLFNAIVGADVAAVDVRRPTTSVTQAAVFGDQADALLDWLGIARRHYVGSDSERDQTAGRLDGVDTTLDFVSEVEGLILVDLPDYDSVELANRAEVDRLVAQVDALIWVVDPQKYADDALHRGYLQPLAGYGDVMRFVLSKTDTLDEEAKKRCLDDLTALVRADGIADPVVLGVSVATGDGMAAFDQGLRAIADEKVQVVERVRADLRNYASGLPELGGDATGSTKKTANRALVQALAAAAGSNEVATNVRHRYRQKATRAIGWPPIRLWAKRRVNTDLAVVPAGIDANSRPQVRLALRNYGDAMADDVKEPVASAIRDAAIASEVPTADGLDKLGYGLRDELRAPRWWSLAGALQWLVFGIAVAGLVWLILLFFVESFLRVRVADYTPNFRDVPLPTWLLLGGLVGGVVLTGLFRILVALSGRRRARRSKAYVEAQAEAVAQSEPIAAVNAVTERANECRRLVDKFA